MAINTTWQNIPTGITVLEDISRKRIYLDTIADGHSNKYVMLFMVGERL